MKITMREIKNLVKEELGGNVVWIVFQGDQYEEKKRYYVEPLTMNSIRY
jgi:hypothetical protein